jgi:hypothetical protein
MSLLDPIPIYVTRKNANGVSATWTINAFIPLLAMFIVFANIILWGIFGFYEVIHVFVRALR